PFSAAKSPTASVPHAPQTPCTETAPTGSSIMSRSSSTQESTTITPPMAPASAAYGTGITLQPAVMETRPASAPLSVNEGSGFLNISQAVAMALSAPDTAAMFVVTAM